MSVNGASRIVNDAAIVVSVRHYNFECHFRVTVMILEVSLYDCEIIIVQALEYPQIGPTTFSIIGASYDTQHRHSA